jgi:hypothetical protein
MYLSISRLHARAAPRARARGSVRVRGGLQDVASTRQTRLVLAKSVQAAVAQKGFLVHRDVFMRALKPIRIPLKIGDKKKEAVPAVDFDQLLWALVSHGRCCCWH